MLFARNLETLGNQKDTLLVISTSANSENIFRHLKLQRKKIFSIGFYGNKGGKCKKISDISIIADSKLHLIFKRHI